MGLFRYAPLQSAGQIQAVQDWLVLLGKGVRIPSPVLCPPIPAHHLPSPYLGTPPLCLLPALPDPMSQFSSVTVNLYTMPGLGMGRPVQLFASASKLIPNSQVGASEPLQHFCDSTELVHGICISPRKGVKILLASQAQKNTWPQETIITINPGLPFAQ